MDKQKLEERIDKQLEITFGLNNLHPAQVGQMHHFIKDLIADFADELIGKKERGRYTNKEHEQMLESYYKRMSRNEFRIYLSQKVKELLGKENI